MQSYTDHNIQELPLSSQFFRQRVERFLGENGLRLEALDVYCAIENEAGEIVAGAGLSSDIIKCVAVSAKTRSEGLVVPLVSHLISLAASRGIHELKLFTKPENQAIFESLGFHVLAVAPDAILMENGRGLEKYCEYLRGFRRPGCSAVVVMNSNPFTLGHRYLLEKAAELADNVYVIPVLEDTPGGFPYEERLAMIRSGIETPDQVGGDGGVIACTDRQSPVIVLEGSSYQISALTFPTYFIKDLSKASETQMLLDLDLFGRHIAPALGASMRIVGSEPSDALTARYNTLMKEVLPLEVVEIHRLETLDQVGGDVMPGCDRASHAVSASAVRKALNEGHFSDAASLSPETTYPYLLAALAERALRMELDTPLKPGLVCPDSPGAHKDMDYNTMERGISAIRPFFPAMAMAPSADELRRLGIEAEEAMMAATGGVNTHRGAIFALGIALNAALRIAPWSQQSDSKALMQNAIAEIAHGIFDNTLKDKDLSPRLIGARAIAATGYQPLFNDWLPYLRRKTDEGTFPGASAQSVLQKTLLRIMSSLDDTCVVKRVGRERAEEVKREAKEIASQVGNDDNALPELLGHLRDSYAEEGISPGGAADMLALTIFIDSISR